MAYVYPTVALEAGLGGSYASQVRADGAIGYWRLGERTGTVAYDVADLSSQPVGAYQAPADGTYTGGYTFGQTSALIDHNAAVLFNGTTGYMASAAKALFTSTSLTPNFSIECWLKPTSVAVDGLTRPFIASQDATWVLNRTDGNLNPVLTYSDSSTSLNQLLYALTAGTWYHVVLTHDGATTRLYINGSQVATYVKALGLFPAGGVVAVYVGSNATHSGFGDGTIDEVALYDILLTPTQIAAHYNANVWTALSTDVRSAYGVSLEYGMADGKATTVVASAGHARFYLDNSQANSAATEGYYSPKNAAVRSGFAVGIPIRLSFTYSGTTYYKFLGRLTDALPAPGVKLERSTVCIASDYMDDLARASLTGARLTPLLTTTQDAVLNAILTAMPSWPASTSFDAGLGSFPYALVNGSEGGRINPLQECQRLALSEARGYIYVKGDTTTGGVFRAENRHARPQTTTPQVTFTDATLWPGMEQVSSIDAIVNRVEVTIHRRRVDVSPAVLWASDTIVDLNWPKTFNVTYRDPTQTSPADSGRISGINMIQPVANLDYKANSSILGDKIDETENVSVIAAFAATGATLTLTNNSDRGVYFVDTAGAIVLQVRGTGVYDYDAPVLIAEDADSQSTYGANTIAVDLPYEATSEIGQGLAEMILEEWSNPLAYVTQVRFIANASGTLLTAALAREPGDLITVTETITGISNRFFINGVHLELDPANVLWCTWILAPGPPGVYWQLDTTGFSELGDTTNLFGI